VRLFGICGQEGIEIDLDISGLGMQIAHKITLRAALGINKNQVFRGVAQNFELPLETWIL
jgi:hypothetical protein